MVGATVIARNEEESFNGEGTYQSQSDVVEPAHIDRYES
jgi:hypothetical protein